MRVAVTGGRGFIGSQLVPALRRDGHAVAVIDVEPGCDGAEAPVDVLDLASLAPAVAGCDLLVHLAGPLLEQAERQPYEAMRLQTLGTLNALEACRMGGVTRLLLASSFYVYAGLTGGGMVDETATPVPEALGAFGAAKLTAEDLVRGLAPGFGVRHSILRLGSAFGPGAGSNVVRSFLEAAAAGGPIEVFGDGSRRSQLTAVADVVDGCLLAMGSASGLFNLVSPEVCTIGALAEALGGWFGCAVRYRLDRPQRPALPHIDSTRAMQELGWRPRPTLERLRELAGDALATARDGGR